MSVYSTKTDGKKAPVIESGNILDLVIENCQNDLKMFDSVITLDFLEAYNDAGYEVVTEAEEEEVKSNGAKAIIQKASEKIDAAVRKIAAFIDKWITKLINIISNDKKLYAEYKDAFKSNAKDTKVKYRPTKDFEKAFKAYEDKIKEVGDKAKEFGDKLSAVKSAEDASGILESMKSYYDDLASNEDFDNLIFTADESEEYTLTDADIANIDSIMGSPEKFSKQADTIKKNIKKEMFGSCLKVCKNLYADIYDDKMFGGVKETIDQDTAGAKANACFTLISLHRTYMTKLTTSFSNQVNKAVADARRVFIKIANAKAATGEQCEILGIASDLYMESALIEVEF